MRTTAVISALLLSLTLTLTLAAPAAQAASRSIGQWVNCASTADQTQQVMAAFAAARNNAFTLIVDCPVRLNSGLAVDRSVFIDNGTTVEFTASGKFFVTNMFHPAFVIANSTDISLLKWNVEWDGAVPSSPDFGGYYLNGKWVAEAGQTQPAQGFNDEVLKPWLTANRGVHFDASHGWVSSIWVGGVNPAAIFFITGQTSFVTVSQMSVSAPPTAGANQFLPVAFSISANWKGNQTVSGQTPETTQYAAVPQWLTFSDITLDGFLMGWQGNLQNSEFFRITAKRYSDLQDANGGTVGGIGKWFPPPHLMYLNTHAADPGLNNINVDLEDIYDEGIRYGVARDTSTASTSGYANSLKLGCTNCSVYNYTSLRPDGFMDVLDSSNLSINTVYAIFDSAFLNNLYPPAIRFPNTQYSHVSFQNVTAIDQALATIHGPLGNAANPANSSIEFSNTRLVLYKWSGSGLPLPTIRGTGNDIALNFQMNSQHMEVAYLQNGTLGVTVTGTPTVVSHGAATALSWSTTAATGCNASGSWSGSLATGGSRIVTLPVAGSYAFTLGCSNAAAAASTTVGVVAQ